MKCYIGNNQLTNYGCSIKCDKNEYCRLGQYSLKKTKKGFVLKKGHTTLETFKNAIDGVKGLCRTIKENR